MTVDDRSKLFNISCELDNRTRLYIPKHVMPFREVPERALDRLRIQDREDTIYVVYSSREVEDIADRLRQLAANDEALLRVGRR